MTTRAHQIAKDNALVAPENRREIGKCNMRIDPMMKRPKETTYQVVLDALALTTCYEAFLITAEVPIIYMHQFWDTVHKRGSSYKFMIDNRKFDIDLEVFRDILSICPRIEGQSFNDPPFEEEVLAFVRHLGHTGEIKYLTDITVDHLHQPWRTFAAIINKCLSGKVSGLDKMRLSRIQILWGMFYKKNVDFVALIWEDLAYQIENKDAKMTDKIYYLRFTKAIISHYLKQNPSISLRNKLFMHIARDDTILGILKFVSKNEDVQTYYAIATGATPPKTKKHRKDYSSKSSEETLTKKSQRIKRSAKVTPAKSKKKAPANADMGKSLKILSDVAMSEDAQLKEALRRSRQDVHISQASGSGSSANEGADDVNIDKSDNESNDDDDDENDDNDDDDDDDNDDEGNDDADDDENEEEEEENDNEKMDLSDEETNKEEDDQYELLYRDVNVNLHEDVDMTNAEQSGTQPKNQEPVLQYEDAHVTLTASQKTEDFEKEAQVEQGRFIDIIDKMVKELAKDEVKGQLNKILLKKIANFATPIIKRNITESQERVVLTKAASQPKSTYEAAASLTEFELKKILLDKMHDSESYRGAQEHRDLYECLAKSYKLDKDLFDTYGEAYSLKRDRDDNEKDEDPSTRLDRGKKRRKSGKEAEPSQEPKSKSSKSISSSKGPTQCNTPIFTNIAVEANLGYYFIVQ
ncbi:hypothetical protein Tco_0578789 [Tanacetum coccineum]